jgi:uncharacterized small protein (DUF1192 family)
MSNGSTLSLAELEDRIAIARDNIRQLIERPAPQAPRTKSATPTASPSKTTNWNG